MSRKLLADLYAQAIHAVDPRRVMPQCTQAAAGEWRFERAGRRVVIAKAAAAGARLRVIGLGKAADTFAEGLLASLPPGFVIDEALVVCRQAPQAGALPDDWQVCLGDHPLPGARSLAAGHAVLDFADAARAGDHHIVLLTGGASALCAAPASGVGLDDKIKATQLLMHAGAPIAEINALRKRLSAVKGGRLGARLASRGASVVTLAVSDVEGDDPAVIGSGPTIADASAVGDLQETLHRRGLWALMPPAVRARIEADLAAEAPTTGAAAASSSVFATVATLDDALAALVAAGERAGLRVVSLGRSLYGEVAAHAEQIASCLRGMRGAGPALLVAGGEPVLRVAGDGLGGRAQELALRVALGIAEAEGVTLLAAGTDGIDGPTCAAGGFADGGTVARIAAAGLDVRQVLARNDSHAALSSAGDLFVTGPTGTNVADVVVAWVA